MRAMDDRVVGVTYVGVTPELELRVDAPGLAPPLAIVLPLDLAQELMERLAEGIRRKQQIWGGSTQ